MQREPELAERLGSFRNGVNDMLLDNIAAGLLGDPGFRVGQLRHPLEEIRSATQILRVLTKETWDQDDMRIFDACWRTVRCSELFADEFEADRFRIESCVKEAGTTLLANGPTSGRR